MQVILFSYPNNGHNLNFNTIRFISCIFENNSEGGTNIWSEEIPMQGDENTIFFTNCSWIGNNATLYGAAVHIMAGTSATGTRGHYPIVSFANCSFSSNKVLPIEQTKDSPATLVNTVSAFYSNILSVVFEGRIAFENNYGTALYLSCSIASFSAGSIVTFGSNYGTNGGALTLLGRSYLYLNGSSNFCFVNNTATNFGGALYFHSVDTVVYQPCFIYNGICNGKSSFYFNRNHAIGGQGPHIFTSSLASCNMSHCNSSCYGTNATDIFKCLGNFTFENPQIKTVGTLPTNFFLNTSLLSVYPGLPQQLNLKVSDAEANSVPKISYRATLAKNESGIHIHSQFQYVSNNTISLVGEPSENDVLQLNALLTDISLLINVSLLECPPGYLYDNSTMTCNCMALKYYGVLKCDPEAYIRYGIWMGKCNSQTLCTADCPVGYCTYHTKELTTLQLPLPMNASQLEEKICAPNRRGTLCGSCKANHSVYYNSWYFACRENKQCNLGPLYFTLSTIIPFMVLFLVLTLLDTNFANGWNGFILFAQVARTFSFYGNGTIEYTNLQFKTLGWVLFIYRFLNMEFFYTSWTEFCIWEGATFMDIQMVKLGSILFCLVLVFLSVCLLNQRNIARFFPCLSRRRYTVINGISTFFILCYTQCIETCFNVLTSTCLLNSNHICVRKVALFSGDMEAFTNVHLKYAAVAISFLIFIVIIPPALLLFYPLFFRLLGICKLSESKIAIFLWRMMPIQVLDSFQNPFKDEYRVFAGLYLLYRALVLTMNVTSQSLVGRYAAVELVLVSITVVHALFQPYKKKLHNIFDLLFFFNLAIINGIIQYIYASFTTSEQSISHKDQALILFWSTLMLILLLIPLLAAFLVFLVKLKMPKVLKKGYHAIQNVI